MSFLTRPASLLRSAAVRPAMFAAPRARQQVRFATSDYGSGAGNPAGEKPEKQGQNPSEDLEHPGPAPPKVAKGKSSSSPNEDQSSSQSSETSAAKQSGSSSSGSSGSKSGGKGAQPKILNEKPPAKENQNEDVKQHNRDMEQRTDRAHEQVNEDGKDDKVSKDYWAGQGGRDKEP